MRIDLPDPVYTQVCALHTALYERAAAIILAKSPFGMNWEAYVDCLVFLNQQHSTYQRITDAQISGSYEIALYDLNSHSGAHKDGGR
jgi:hypothetical protein